MKQNTKIKAVLLFASSMTVMAGAIIAPALTEIASFFSESSDIVIKLIITMPALIIAFFGTIMGTLSDKWGRKNLLVYSLIIYGIGGFSGYFISQIELLLLSRAILGIGVSGIMSIATTLISDYFDGEERNSFVGSQAAFMSLGGVVFLTAGGLLADMNWRFPFILYLAAFLILPLVIFVLYEPKKEDGYENIRGNQEMTVNRNAKIVALVYLIGFLGMVFFYMIPTQIPFLLNERLEINNTLNGVAIALTTLTGAITSIKYGAIKKIFSFPEIFVISFLFISLGYFLIAQNVTYAGILLGLAIAGLGIGLLMPNCNLWLMEVVSIKNRGKIIGGISSTMFLGQFISPLIIGIFISQFSLTYAFYISSGLMLILTSILFLISRKKNKST